MDAKKIENSFSKISENEAWRESFINSMLAFEKEIGRSHIDVREDVSGPLVDSIFDDSKVIRKTLSDGTVLDFYYRSKIARDFLMSEPRVPDHAWEPNTTKLLLDLAAGAKNVVIGGAYFGDQAILIAKKISSISGVVHAFEPNNEQRGMLVHNSQLNNLANIKARNEGLWDNSTTSLTLVGYDSFAHPEAASESDVDAFQTVTIADYMSAAGAEELGLIMLDIEGAELKALKGAESFLSKPVGSAPNVVFEVHKSYMDWSKGLENTEIVKYLSDFGYHVFAVRDFNSNFDLSSQPIELIPCDSVYLKGPDHGFNMVAVKDLSLVSGDNYRMCKNVSPKYLRHKDPALHFPLNGL